MKNIEKKRERDRLWRKNNQDKIKANRCKYYDQRSIDRSRLWRKENKEYLKEYRSWYYYKVRVPRKNLNIMEQIKKGEKESWSVDRTNSIHHPWHTGRGIFTKNRPPPPCIGL